MSRPTRASRTRPQPRRLRAVPAPELQYRLLLELSHKVSRTLDLQEVLDQLLAALRSAVDYDAAGIFVLAGNVPLGRGRQGGLIAGMATVGFPPPRSDDPMLRFGKGLVGHVIRSGRPVVVPDVRREPLYVEGRPNTLSEVAVPIVSNDRVIGALNLESDRSETYTALDAEQLAFFASAAALLIEKALLHREVLGKQRLEHQLQIAHDVQAGLLPVAPPQLAGYDLAGVQLTSQAVGGDYYDYLSLPDGRLGLVIADVSGKGIPAALIMATFRAALIGELRRSDDLPGALAEVNRTLLESQSATRFVTTVCGLLEPVSGRFCYVNAGHNPPLVLRADGGRHTLERGGPALGFFEQPRYEAGETSLGVGDALVLFTDGVVEATGASDGEFGSQRLEDTLRATAGLRAEAGIRAAIQATGDFSGRDDYDDDFTLVVVKRLGTAR